MGTHSDVQWVHVQDNTISLQIIPPEPVVIGVPQHLNVAESGGGVTLRWTAPALPAGTAVTGYRIERHQHPALMEFILGEPATRWTDPTDTPSRGTTILYRVAARVGNREGAPSDWRRVVNR